MTLRRSAVVRLGSPESRQPIAEPLGIPGTDSIEGVCTIPDGTWAQTPEPPDTTFQLCRTVGRRFARYSAACRAFLGERLWTTLMAKTQ